MYKHELEAINKYKLSQKEIEKAINEGLLQQEIDSIVTEKGADGYYHQKTIDERLNSLGIKEYFISFYATAGNFKWNFAEPSFFITDFYLIICDAKRSYFDMKNFKDTLYKKPDEIYVIPLDKIKNFQVYISNSFSAATESRTYEIKKDPAIGAVIGGLIAGPTGAVIGAAANSGTKKEIIPGTKIDMEYYDLKIVFNDNEKILREMFYKNDKSIRVSCPTVSEDIINEKISNTAELILNSKKKTTLQEKQEIVNKTVSEGKIAYNDQEKSGDGCIIFLIIGFLLLCMIIALYK